MVFRGPIRQRSKLVCQSFGWGRARKLCPPKAECNGKTTLFLGLLSLLLEGIIIWRARAGKFLSRFPLFYSYLMLVFMGSAGAYAARWLSPRYYEGSFWIFFMVTLVAEFAVLVEISDHIFNSYPAVRSLGRMLTGAISIGFFVFYIVPALAVPGSPGGHVAELVKRSSVTKAVIIVCLLAVARSFDLPMNTNTSGMMVGLGLYLSSNIVNFELAARLNRAQYGSTFAIVGPVSYTLCLLVWTVALWRYEPAVIFSREARPGDATLVPDLLGRFNNSLSRLLRK